MSERFAQEAWCVGGDCGFLLLACGMPNPDVKPGEQEGGSKHGAARVGGEAAGPRWIQEAIQIGKERMTPHVRVLRRRERIEQNGVGRGNRPGCNRHPDPVVEQGWKVAQDNPPLDLLRMVIEFDRVRFGGDQPAQERFVAGEIPKFRNMVEGEQEGGDGLIETDQTNAGRDSPCGAQDGQRIGGGAEADIPDHELALVICQPLAQSQLADMQRLRLGRRPNDRMKRFPRGDGMDAVNTVGQGDKGIIVMAQTVLRIADLPVKYSPGKFACSSATAGLQALRSLKAGGGCPAFMRPDDREPRANRGRLRHCDGLQTPTATDPNRIGKAGVRHETRSQDNGPVALVMIPPSRDPLLRPREG